MALTTRIAVAVIPPVTSRYQHVLEETARAAAEQVGTALWGK